MPSERADPLGAHAVPGEDLAEKPPGAVSVERARSLRSSTPIRSRAERLLHVRTAEWWLRSTATSERKVAVDLERLGPQWNVLHAVPVGPDRPAISHLAIGPAGVFTLSTRGFRAARPPSLSDRVEAAVLGDDIKIHGETLPYVAQARAQAWRAARVLSGALGQRIFVRPAVVIVGVDEVRFYDIPQRVDVLPRRQLVPWLRGFPARHGAADVERLFSVARRSETWLDPTGKHYS